MLAADKPCPKTTQKLASLMETTNLFYILNQGS